MKLFSFLKKEKVLRCDYCKKEIDSPNCTAVFGNSECVFCSETCKKNFEIWYKKMSSCGTNCCCH